PPVPVGPTNSSALTKQQEPCPMPSYKYPPATNTVPSSTDVAEWPARRAGMVATAVNVPRKGSKTSALACVPEKKHDCELQSSLSPPAIKTVPSCRNVAEWLSRGRVIEPVAVNVPVTTS